MKTSQFPPRLHVLLASEAPFGLIILRPSRQKGDFHTCTIGWNRTDDSFKLGQWLKGKIYEQDCDLSPDGKHFLYFVAGYSGSWKQGDSQPYRIWTAVSRAPYLKALVFRGQMTTHCSGGRFEDNNRFWFNGENEGQTGLEDELEWIPQPPSKTVWAMEADKLYDLRMRRGGWKARELAPSQRNVALWKKTRNAWTLEQFSHYYCESEHPIGRGPFWQWYRASDNLSGETLGDQSWEWADFDNDRLVWAQGGKLFATPIWDGGHGDIIELANFNDWKFTAVQAPY
ncbi:hypothetical protein IAD21_01256 [Abditibacteriota bacterium]|nr:hypothetical protein IAD21_01256 [Abditibacteriota bacterium]